jgi:hypothetical protein
MYDVRTREWYVLRVQFSQDIGHFVVSFRK